MNDKKGQLIVLERPLNRKQLALPPLSSITGWKYWNGAMGGWVGGGCLIGNWSSGGLEVMLCLCPSQYRQEGTERELPQALAATGGLCGLSSWVLSHQAASQPSIRDKHQTGLSVHVCPLISIRIFACVHLHSCASINIGNSFCFYVNAQNNDHDQIGGKFADLPFYNTELQIEM